MPGILLIFFLLDCVGAGRDAPKLCFRLLPALIGPVVPLGLFRVWSGPPGAAQTQCAEFRARNRPGYTHWCSGMEFGPPHARYVLPPFDLPPSPWDLIFKINLFLEFFYFQEKNPTQNTNLQTKKI